jgi:hypothetical protein
MECCSYGQYDLASIDDFFIIIANLSKFSTLSLQCQRLVNIPTMLKILLVFNLGPRNP